MAGLSQIKQNSYCHADRRCKKTLKCPKPTISMHKSNQDDLSKLHNIRLPTKKIAIVSRLPPSASSIKLHVLKAFVITNKYGSRQQLVRYLLQLDRSQQVASASTKDTAIPKGVYGSGNTPLILSCYLGFTDMVQWLLHNDVDVDQCRDDGVYGMYMACQEGETTIVNMLLENNPNLDLCDNEGVTYSDF
ncbi:unnamed protein product [Mytilus edulis]|uniref:Uncharacterized protein n=1 Tax=Mytilus edulis TaxID=6550 RepID=A0A8S3PZD6_MYTED|nr:unnamed protein product [Mytilus edulis]